MKYTLINTNTRANQTWRPWPLRKSFLVGFLLICIFLNIGIQFIIQGCLATGCRVFGPLSTTRTTPTTFFVYNLLPTILSLVFSLLWSVTHHDILRMEPYFQMSVVGGVEAEDSILLGYAYMFPLIVPVAAFKRRHYVPFLSACILLLITLLITPLASGLFDDTELTKYVDDVATRRAIYPEESQYEHLSAGFGYTAYDYWFLDGSLPPFTTPTYALLPIVQDPNSTIGIDAVSNETWVAETTLFEAELVCEGVTATPFKSSRHRGMGVVGMDFVGRDGEDHNVLFDYAVLRKTLKSDNFIILISDLLSELSGHASFYNGNFSTPWATMVGYFNERYLFAWMSAADPAYETTPGISALPLNWTAIACTPLYYSQTVTATFTMPSGIVKHVERSGVRTQFNVTEEFFPEINGFRDSIGDRYSNISQGLNDLGKMTKALPRVDSQLRQLLGSSTDSGKGWQPLQPLSSDMVDDSRSSSIVGMNNIRSLSGFALNNQRNDTLAELLDPAVFARVNEEAFQLLFSFAVSQEWLDENATEIFNITRAIRTKGFEVNLLWARGLQGGLAVVAIMTIFLGFLSCRRNCELDGEPNSLAAALRLLAVSADLSKTVEYAEFHSPEELQRVLSGCKKRYNLRLEPEQGPKVYVVDPGGDNVGLTSPEEASLEPWVGNKLLALRNSFQFSVLTASAFIVVLLVVLFGYAHGNNGLPAPSVSSSFGYKIPFSYIPLVIGQAVEPVLVTISSAYCMLGPYRILRRGLAPSSKSLAVDFDKSPPHFQFFRSARSGYIVLAALTVTIILANALSVAFAGLFSPMMVEIDIKSEVLTTPTPAIRGKFTEPAQEMYYVLDGVLSRGIAAPMWTTPEYYVLPFAPVDLEDVLEYEGPTLGIGADVECSLLPAANTNLICFTLGETNSTSCTPPNLKDPSGVISADDPCWDFEGSSRQSWSRLGSDYFKRSANCSDTFFAVWVGVMETLTPETAYIDAAILKCTTTERVVELIATVNEEEQNVLTTDVRQLAAKEVAELYTTSTNISDHLAPTFLDTLLIGTRTGGVAGPHSMEWLNYLMATVDPSLIQPGDAIPDRTLLPAAFEKMLRRLFAINLYLYIEDIIETGEQKQAAATAIVRRGRAQMSVPMFIIAITILIYMIAVLVILNWVDGLPILGHLPTTLAGMYVSLYASNAKEECAKVPGKNPEERAKRLEEIAGRYSYGYFEGEDKREHYGVYRENEEVKPTDNESEEALGIED